MLAAELRESAAAKRAYARELRAEAADPDRPAPTLLADLAAPGPGPGTHRP